MWGGATRRFVCSDDAVGVDDEEGIALRCVHCGGVWQSEPDEWPRAPLYAVHAVRVMSIFAM